jgi:hypothetical protein
MSDALAPAHGRRGETRVEPDRYRRSPPPAPLQPSWPSGTGTTAPWFDAMAGFRDPGRMTASTQAKHAIGYALVATDRNWRLRSSARPGCAQASALWKWAAGAAR